MEFSKEEKTNVNVSRSLASSIDLMPLNIFEVFTSSRHALLRRF